MKNTNAFAGVGVPGLEWALRSARSTAPMVHPVSAAHAAGAAAAIAKQRTRRTATAIVASVDRGTT